MPYKNESMLMGGDASADTSTELCFNPPEGPFDASNVVTGTINRVGDEDWIAIKLTEGNTYTITTGGDTTGTADDPKLNDSVLKLMTGKGELITMNDDVKPADGMLGSEIEFTPEAGTGTQVYFISVSGYNGNPGANNTGSYTVSVAEVAVLPAGEGADIEGTPNADKLTGTDDSESIAGLGGNDTIYGGGGDDTLAGGDGNDLLVGGPGADTLNGGDHAYDEQGFGGDTISYIGSPMGVTINLRAGVASGGDAEGDTLGEDIENIMGSMHDDSLTGSRGNNGIWGLGGNDHLAGDRGMDALFGGPGDDTLDGDDGNDLLVGGPGADELTGGDGSDTASYGGSMYGVTIRLHSQQAMGGDAEGDTWGDTTTVTYMLPDEDGVMQEHEETVPDIVSLIGSGMDDILAGDSRANFIQGGGGDDKIYGGPGGGNDHLHGDDGDDMIFGGHGGDVLAGGDGDDMLNGGADGDWVYAGAGSDMIYADSDDVVINGWLAPWDADDDPTTDTDTNYEGPEDPDNMGTALTEAQVDPMAVDTVSYEKLKSGVTIVLGTNTVNVENLIGTNENDMLTGDLGANVINGLDGADDMDGGDGIDTVSYEHSDRGVNVTVNAAGAGSASGGHAQGDEIDNFENATGSAHDDNLTGDGTANVLSGLAGNDELVGGDGDDTVEGGAGADEMDGDNGNETGQTRSLNDTLSYSKSSAGVHVNLTALTFAGGHAEGDKVVVMRDAFDPDGAGDMDPVDVSTFEHLTGSDHDDRLTGDHRANTLTGGKGDDMLRGMAGVDMLIGGPGADHLDGGEDAREENNLIPARVATDLNGDGDTDDPGEAAIDLALASVDVASYAGAMAGVTVNLASGRGTAGDAMGDTLVNIEQVEGSSNDDTFIAGPGPDSVDGGLHNADDPEGGTDTEDGDTISYELSPEAVTIVLGATGNQNALGNAVDGLQGAQGDQDSYAVGDTLVGIENVMGSDQDDMITGDANANRLMGGAGEDTLDGGDGNDTLMGGDGDDMLNGEGDEDTIMGGAGGDTIDGGLAADTITGGAGDDSLTGGDGVDTFVFSPGPSTEVDVIEDFVATDKINLKAFGLEAADVAKLISTRGDDIVINLTSVGGGTIVIGGSVNDVDELEAGGAGSATDTTADVIDSLSVQVDLNGDGDFTGDGETDGIFIL